MNKLSVVVLFIVSFAASVQAAPLTYNFTGIVGTDYAGNQTAGSVVKGFISLDTSTLRVTDASNGNNAFVSGDQVFYNPSIPVNDPRIFCDGCMTAQSNPTQVQGRITVAGAAVTMGGGNIYDSTYVNLSRNDNGGNALFVGMQYEGLNSQRLLNFEIGDALGANSKFFVNPSGGVNLDQPVSWTKKAGDGTRSFFELYSYSPMTNSYEVGVIGELTSLESSRVPLPAAPGATSLVALGNATDFDPSKPVVVVTHGWQPTRNYLDQQGNILPSPLIDLQSKIKAELPDLPDGNILSFSWEDASTVLPKASLAATANAGAELSQALQNYLGNDYKQKVHLIGHSHGTLVNAEAIFRINGSPATPNKLDIAQATLLDTPRGVLPTLIHAGVTADALYYRMPTTSVTYVDSFYGGGVDAVGNYLPYAGPGDSLLNQLVPWAGHSEVWNQFYINTIGSNQWISPLLGESAFDERRVGANRTWNPVTTATIIAGIPTELFEVIIGVGDSINTAAYNIGSTTAELLIRIRNGATEIVGAIYRGSVHLLNSLGEFIFDELVVPVNRIAVSELVLTPAYYSLTESSPSAIEQTISIPNGTDLLSFDLLSLAPNDGDWITVHFEDELLFTYMIDNLGVDLINSFIPVEEYEGQTGKLTVRLNSVGDSNAQFAIGNFAFLNTVISNEVPEPGTLTLLAFGLIFIVTFTKKGRPLGVPLALSLQ